MPNFSKRSADNLKGVHPKLAQLMTAAIEDSPVDFTITEGLRTTATQQMYYSWGRTVVNPNTGPLKGKPKGATNTQRDGVKVKSNHQAKADGYGHAVDLYPYVDGAVRVHEGYVGGKLRQIADHIKKHAKRLGIKIVWGGDWKTPHDPPHFELA